MIAPRGSTRIAQMAKLNNATGNAANPADMAAALAATQMKWTKGRVLPVSDTLKVDDDTHHYSLQVENQQQASQ